MTVPRHDYTTIDVPNRLVVVRTFVSKPVEVQAVHWLTDQDVYEEMFSGAALTKWIGNESFITQTSLGVTIHFYATELDHHRMMHSPGDWIIKDADGFYGQTDEEFRANYTEVIHDES